MPTIMWINDLRVVIYPNDHRPPHVHVIGTEAEAVFVLVCSDGVTRLLRSVRFSVSELNKIAANLNKNIRALCKSWETIHGNRD